MNENKDNQTQQDDQAVQKQKVHSLDDIVGFCKFYSLNAVQIGKWVWVKFAGEPNVQMQRLLKRFGFRWSERRKMYAHDCGHPSQPSNEVPWHRYAVNNISGSVNLED